VQLAQDTVVADRYRLIGRLGSGGMADVWCAEDGMLNRRVALKFLHDRFAQDEQFVERFRREASAAAGLQHQNVVGVFDRGTYDGSHYIAMEYVEGASLKDLIDRGLSVPEAVEIVRQVLAFAPTPGAWFEAGGERVKVLAAEVEPSERDSRLRGNDGLVLDDQLTIACGEGAIRPALVQRAGRAPMSPGELLRGFAIPAGTILR